MAERFRLRVEEGAFRTDAGFTALGATDISGKGCLNSEPWVIGDLGGEINSVTWDNPLSMDFSYVPWS